MGVNNKRPIIGITMGDPASIGPEITLKCLSSKNVYEKCKPIVVGDAKCLENAKKIVNLNNIEINSIEDVQSARFEYGIIDVLDMHNADMDLIKIGKISKQAGEASFQYVDKVIELALNGEVDATVTNAFSKEAINLAGHHYSGHTEVYAEKTATEKYTMMLVYKNIRVVHVSTHCALRDACDKVKKERILDVIKIAQKACLDLGIDKPRIGVAGLNPHCGENGLFGNEETDEIIPAINEAKQLGICVDGPVPADTIFSKIRGNWYDIVVAMYHDQGHIPLKVLGFVYNDQAQKWDAVEGVNITLGLPIIRTSVDHGTAFDQAGTGNASELSLKNALEYAITMANVRNSKR